MFTVPNAGVPLRVAVPPGPVAKDTPLGRLPDSPTVGVGIPVAVTANVNRCPDRTVRVGALVITGAAFLTAVVLVVEVVEEVVVVAATVETVIRCCP